MDDRTGFVRTSLWLALNVVIVVAGPVEAQRLVGPVGPGAGTAEFAGASGAVWWPFRGEQELQEAYDSETFGFGEYLYLTALLPDTTEAPTTWAEIASYIPKSGILRMGLSLQLTQAELADSSVSQQDIALQKLVNGGGTLALSIGRPLVYSAGWWDGQFLLVDAATNFFADVTAINQPIYDPGWGVQVRSSLDLRIATYGTSRQEGNLVRVGFRARAAKNLVNEEWDNAHSEDDELRELEFLALDVYLGLAFVDAEISKFYGDGTLVDGRDSSLTLHVVNVKF